MKYHTVSRKKTKNILIKRYGTSQKLHNNEWGTKNLRFRIWDYCNLLSQPLEAGCLVHRNGCRSSLVTYGWLLQMSAQRFNQFWGSGNHLHTTALDDGDRLSRLMDWDIELLQHVLGYWSAGTPVFAPDILKYTGATQCLATNSTACDFDDISYISSIPFEPRFSGTI